MSQDQVKRLSTLVAAHMSMCLDAACGDLYATDDVKPEEIRKTWEKVAAETLRLDVIPPAFEQLRRKRNRRKPVPYELIPGSLARMLCADWWYRKLWKMRCEWREEQLRAVCLVSKKASPYVSYEAVMHKREQRRKSLEFFRSHELVNEDGDTLDMEDVVNASSSNPAHRRNEMMACVKGLELIAEMRGDCAVFYTITCPSRFHSTLNNGRPNPTWTNATVRQSSDYLVGMFAAFRKAMHKAGLRWYGVRVTKDAMGTIQRVLEKVNALPQDKRLSAMTMLFGKEFGDDAAKLANNLPELQRQLKLTAGNDALGSMQKESDINKDSLSAQWLLVKTGAQNTFSSLGETLRQPLMDILYTVKSVTGALRRWVEANPELTGTLMKVVAVVAAVTVGLGTLAVALAAVLGPLAVIRLGFSVLGIKTLPSVTAAVTRTSSALSWLAGAPLALLRRGLASSGNAAGLLTAPLSSLRRTALLTGNVLKTVAGAPVALLRSGLSGLRAVAVMFMNPLAVLRGGLAAAGTVLRVLASGPLAMLRVALYAVSGLLGALLSPIGLVVTALAGVALVVWKYWQPITAFLGGVVEGFKAAAGPVSEAFEPLKPVFQWIGDKVQALWGWFTDLLTPVKSTSAELQSAAAMGRRFGEALAEGLNMVMHPLDSLKSGVSWLLEKLGIVSKEAAKAKLPESVTRQQPATVNADGKVMMPSGGFPSWGYGFAGMYDSGGYIPRGQFGIVGENGPEIVNGPANVTSRRNTAALAAVVAGMMGVAAAPAELPPLHPLALPAKGGEAIVSRAATVPPVYRIEAPTQIIIQTQPGQSAQDIAREVARQLDERERRLKAKARSNYSDQGGYDA
ncbi:phage tail tape measure protein [Escherichia coli]|nr:phage tail tape measure protein [Escherichia coli]